MGFGGLLNKAKGLAGKGLAGLKGLGGKGLAGLKGLGGKAAAAPKKAGGFFGGLKGLGGKIGSKLSGFKNSLAGLIKKGGNAPKMAPLSPAAMAANAKGKAFCAMNCMINPISVEKKCLDG